jgi:hypothetical protein
MEERSCLLDEALITHCGSQQLTAGGAQAELAVVLHHIWGRLMLQMPDLVGNFVNGVDHGMRCLVQQKAVALEANNHLLAPGR